MSVKNCTVCVFPTIYLVGKESVYSKITNLSLCVYRETADPKGGPEHCCEGSPKALQSPRAGCIAVAPTSLSFGPQEAKEQPVFK